MKGFTMVLKVFARIMLSILFGLLVWFAAHSLVLPVTEVDDGYGHGSD